MRVDKKEAQKIVKQWGVKLPTLKKQRLHIEAKYLNNNLLIGKDKTGYYIKKI